MDLTRLRLGELLAGAAAVALVATLFLDWNRDSRGSAETGWGAIGVAVLLLLLVAVGLALTLVVTTAGKRPAAIPIGAAVLTSGVGIVVTVVLAVRVLLLDDSLGGAYLGLAATALIAAGGWRAMADERTGAPYSAAPELPRRPAPPVGA